MKYEIINKIRYSIQYARKRKFFEQANCFCMFSGYPRSGHSLVGAVMDAHPQMIISHELDVIEMMHRGFSYRQICAMIMENSHRFAMEGRIWSNYKYDIPGQWQGKARNLKVIGDKKGGRTSLLLSQNFKLVERLKEFIPINLKFIHVVRNPFDNIVTRAMQGNYVRKEITAEGVKKQIPRHFEQADTNFRLIRESGCRVLTIRHENMISNPSHTMIEICNFLDVEAPADWLEACSSIVFAKPHLTRKLYNYPPEQVEEIMKRMESFPFFEGYNLID